MEKSVQRCVCALLAITLCGCAGMHRKHAPVVKVEVGPTSPFPAYAGPKVAVTVADFEVTAAKASGEIGAGLREMFVAALLNSNHVTVVGNKPAVLAPAATPEAAAAPGTEATPDAKLVIAAAVTEFEPESSGGSGGIGGGGGSASGMMGGLLDVSQNKAHLTLDIRILDAGTSTAIASTQVQGQASDIAPAFMSGFFGGWPLGTALEAYAHTPMEKAIRICIIEAVRYIAQHVPSGQDTLRSGEAPAAGTPS